MARLPPAWIVPSAVFVFFAVLFVVMLPIRETFDAAPPASLDVYELPLMMIATLPKTFFIGARLDDSGVPILVGDRLVLSRCPERFCTGRAFGTDERLVYVTSTTRAGIVVTDARVTTLDAIGGTLYARNRVIIATEGAADDGELLYVRDARCYGVASSDGDVVLIKVVKFVDDPNDGAPFECYGAAEYVGRRLCEANGFAWDKRCMFDFECPEGRACANGFCAVPPTAQRRGYTS
jgi:hypothetical protein